MNAETFGLPLRRGRGGFRGRGGPMGFRGGRGRSSGRGFFAPPRGGPGFRGGFRSGRGGRGDFSEFEYRVSYYPIINLVYVLASDSPEGRF